MSSSANPIPIMRNIEFIKFIESWTCLWELALQDFLYILYSGLGQGDGWRLYKGRYLNKGNPSLESIWIPHLEIILDLLLDKPVDTPFEKLSRHASQQTSSYP